MPTVALSAVERVKLRQLASDTKAANGADFSLLIEIMALLDLTEEERAAIAFTETYNEVGSFVMAGWKEGVIATLPAVAIDFKDKHVNRIKAAIQAAWPTMTPSNDGRWLPAVQAKLGLD